MTESQIIDICTFFTDEMYNGGFLQLLYNDSNAYLKHIPQCLTAIGADKMADICQTALSVFSCPLPDDLEQRRHYLSKALTPDIIRHLQACDTQFNKLSDQLDTCLDRFIAQHFPDNPITIDREKPKDYAALICKLESRTPSTDAELLDAKLRRQQNKAATEIHKLKMELFARPDKGAPVILHLLQSEDPRVRISAGAYCLQAQIHENLGKRTLMQIADDPALDRYLRFHASMCIEYCWPYKTQ